MPEDAPSKEPTASAPTSEEQALIDDLHAIYDNPEVVLDFSRLEFPKFRILNLLVLGYPDLIHVEINRDNLSIALREGIFGFIPPEARLLLQKDYQTESWEETREAILSDREYWETEGKAFWFFMRHFPRLMVRLYETVMQMSLISVVGPTMDDPDREKLYRDNLKRMLGGFKRDIKEMLGTRKRGGSRGKLDASTRGQFHLWYADIHTFTRMIKKHYDKMLKEFAENRKSRGYKHEEWQTFWASYTKQFYDDYPDGTAERELIILLADPNNLSASEAAYTWMAQKTDYTVSHVKRLVLEARKKSQ